jgi:hypothetical protein
MKKNQIDFFTASPIEGEGAKIWVLDENLPRGIFW